MASDDPKPHGQKSISEEIDLAEGAFFLGTEENSFPAATPAAPLDRPAQAAHAVDSLPNQVLDPAANGTADFLGLDAELRAQQDGQGSVEANATNSWLWSVEQEEHAAFAQSAENAQSAQAGDLFETSIDPDGIGDEITLAPAATDEPVAPRRSRRSRRFALLTVGIALVAGAGTMMWYAKHMQSTSSEAPIVALAPQIKAPVKSAPKTQPAPTPVTVAQVPTPTPAPEPISEPVLVTASEPLVASEQPLTEASAVESSATTPPSVTPQPGLTFIPSGTPAPKAAPTTLPTGARHPSSDDLRGIWSESTIPFDAVDARDWLHTPHVGAVRVRLKSGGAFEGRLDCVGFSQYWIDIGIGQLGFDGDYVALVETIDVPVKDAGKEPDFQTRIAGLPYVEVRVAGGWMAGWQLAREGRSVTLITPEPGKVTLESDEVRPASTGRSFLRGPVQKN